MLNFGEVNWELVLLHKLLGQALPSALIMSNTFHLQVLLEVPLSINKSKRIWPVTVCSFPHSPAALKIATPQDLAIPFSHIHRPNQRQLCAICSSDWSTGYKQHLPTISIVHKCYYVYLWTYQQCYALRSYTY